MTSIHINRFFLLFLLLGFLCNSSFLFAQKPAVNNTVVMASLPQEVVAHWNAELNNKNVVLQWTSASENNLSHFVIQKSYNGTDYSDLAIFFAAEKGDKRAGYKYTDKLNPLTEGKVYYRLKMQDVTGKNCLTDCLTVLPGRITGEMISSVSPKQHN